jgi:[ribosomal protein S5]-alanine N-acetyltransferase
VTVLSLRPITVDDVPFLEQLHRDDEYAFFAVDRTPTHAELVADIGRDGVDCRLVLDANRPVGWVRLDYDYRNATAALGYGVDRRHWGRGYATEGVRRMVDDAFNAPDLHKVWARVDPRNAASMRVLGKVGFRMEGVLESHFVRRGERVDRAMFGMTRAAWELMQNCVSQDT